MPFQPRRQRRAFAVCVGLVLLLLQSLPSWGAEKMRLRVDDYQIDAELTPHTHTLKARAKVKFTALEDLPIATFQLHNDLRVTKVLDASNKPLSAERLTQDSSVRVQLPDTLKKDTATTLTFEYEGVLDSADDSPVQGLKLASVNEDTSYLLYAGYWFPVNAYGINRFTATINVTVPEHMIVIGSGKETASNTPPPTGRKRELRRRDVPRPRPTRSPGISPASPALSLPDLFRNTKAMKPVWTCMFSSSRHIRTSAPCTLKQQSRNSPTT